MAKSTTDAGAAYYSLERYLAPLWKITYYIGMFFDWCRPIPQKSCFSTEMRCFMMGIGLLFTAYNSVVRFIASAKENRTGL